ncbi:MAG: M20 family metallopeptidase [Cloacibacillus sp.]
MNNSDLTKLIDKFLPEVISFRRRMHEEPDLSGREQPTCARIAEMLDARGIGYERLLDGTALCARIGRGAARAVAIRADIDALPVSEATGLSFASRRPGVMHACGHDIHAACALGAAFALKEMERDLEGGVTILFQPAEETTGGAERMIGAGVLECPRVTHVIGLHVDPSLEAGRASFMYGKMHAASDEFTIVFTGRGCHGAHPDEGCDAIAAAALFVTAVQNVVSRALSPLEPGVVTIGSIHGGTKGNIIADSVEVTGIMRSLDEKTRKLLRRRVEETAVHTAASLGARAGFILRPSYTALINDDETVSLLVSAARGAIGDEKVVIKKKPTMGTEDFAYFAAARPSCFYELGCGFSERDENPPLHSAGFEADEKCIKTGILLQTSGALALLKNN